MNGKGNDAADMNSTPIGKLPPPSNLSMRAEAISGDASYQEILKNMELHRTMQSQQLSAPPAPQQQMQMQMQQMQQMQAPSMRQQMQVDDDDATDIVPAKPSLAAPKQQQHRPGKKKSSSSRIDLRKLRPALVVATIVFLVLSRGAPMIATRLPFSVDAITGKFTMAGLLIISMLSGGMYLGINELIKRYISDPDRDD